MLITRSTQEDSPRHNGKNVDWVVKNQNNTNTGPNYKFFKKYFAQNVQTSGRKIYITIFADELFKV